VAKTAPASPTDDRKPADCRFGEALRLGDDVLVP
jgi:hypothetical protein